MSSTHETFSREETVKAGSDRAFGITFAVVFGILTGIHWWHDGHWVRELGTTSLLFLAAGLLVPSVLGPLNRAWLKFGLLLHKIVNPLIMGLLFYGTVLPTGLVMRARGRDLLRLKRDPAAPSYWIRRTPPGPAPESMKDQF